MFAWGADMVMLNTIDLDNMDNNPGLCGLSLKELKDRCNRPIGVYLGYTVAHYADFYKPIRHVEVLGRVVSGEGGQIILSIAKKILADEFPELTGINFYEPDEREKRHGQAAAAASLPLTK